MEDVLKRYLPQISAALAVLSPILLRVARPFPEYGLALGPGGPQPSMLEIVTSKPVVGVVVTLLVLVSALYVVLSKKYGAAEQKWAYGAIGAVTGHWLGKA